MVGIESHESVGFRAPPQNPRFGRARWFQYSTSCEARWFPTFKLSELAFKADVTVLLRKLQLLDAFLTKLVGVVRIAVSRKHAAEWRHCCRVMPMPIRRNLFPRSNAEFACTDVSSFQPVNLTIGTSLLGGIVEVESSLSAY